MSELQQAFKVLNDNVTRLVQAVEDAEIKLGKSKFHDLEKELATIESANKGIDEMVEHFEKL